MPKGRINKKKQNNAHEHLNNYYLPKPKLCFQSAPKQIPNALAILRTLKSKPENVLLVMFLAFRICFRQTLIFSDTEILYCVDTKIWTNSKSVVILCQEAGEASTHQVHEYKTSKHFLQYRQWIEVFFIIDSFEDYWIIIYWVELCDIEVSFLQALNFFLRRKLSIFKTKMPAVSRDPDNWDRSSFLYFLSSQLLFKLCHIYILFTCVSFLMILMNKLPSEVSLLCIGKCQKVIWNWSLTLFFVFLRFEDIMMWYFC